jgi:hypothetical protein
VDGVRGTATASTEVLAAETSALVSQWFDPKELAKYLLETGNFVHPMSRRPLERSECLDLDRLLRQHRLGRPAVTNAFDHPEFFAPVHAPAASAEAQAAAAAAEMTEAQQAADALRANLLGPGRSKGKGAPWRPRPGRAPPPALIALLASQVARARAMKREREMARVGGPSRTAAGVPGGSGGRRRRLAGRRWTELAAACWCAPCTTVGPAPDPPWMSLTAPWTPQTVVDDDQRGDLHGAPSPRRCHLPRAAPAPPQRRPSWSQRLRQRAAAAAWRSRIASISPPSAAAGPASPPRTGAAAAPPTQLCNLSVLLFSPRLSLV